MRAEGDNFEVDSGPIVIDQMAAPVPKIMDSSLCLHLTIN
jgi:hypothetical protein